MIGKLIGKALVVAILGMAAAPFCSGQAPPSNDNFSNRIVLTGNTVAFSGALAGATLQPNEALGGYGANQLTGNLSQSIWWTWTAPQTSLVIVEMIGASSDSQIQGGEPVDGVAIYDTTNVFTQADPVAQMGLDVSMICEALRFSATEGSNYQIQVIGSSSTAYQFLLVATDPPLILQVPRSLTVSSNASTLFTVVADGYRPLRYQWQMAGTNLPGQTATMLALTNIDGSQAGSYSVIVTNVGGSVTSAPAVLAVSAAIVQPSLMAVNGDPGQFVLVLSGEVGRNYRIESSVDLAGWTGDYSFPRYPFWYVGEYSHNTPYLTSIIFNTNGNSSFVITNDQGCQYFRASQYQPANEICINNMRQIRFAKLLWRRDFNNDDFDGVRWLTPTGFDLAPYFLAGALPSCPLDPDQTFPTSYIPDDCQTEPVCEIVPQTHILEEPQQ
jgi:hypothetical protein